MMPEHCRTGTETSISKDLFDLHMQFAGNKYFSGKLQHTYIDQNGGEHTYIDQNDETAPIKPLPVF